MRVVASCSNYGEFSVAVYEVHLENLVVLILLVGLVDAVPINPQILMTQCKRHFDVIIYNFGGAIDYESTAVTFASFWIV